MESYQHILDKLKLFIKKYYTLRLVRGLILFVLIGSLIWLAVTAAEYVLWMGTTARLVLLLVLVLAGVFLLYRYILEPLFYLFQLKNGIGNKEASKLIGRHFSEVDDRLVNLLDLVAQPGKSDLLVAAIESRSTKLRPIPFQKALNYKDSIKNARWLVVPLAVVLTLLVSGKLDSFLGSHNRLLNYEVAYAKPAPFNFVLMNDSLRVLENEALTIMVATEGSVRPERVLLDYGGKDIVMRSDNGQFIHKLEPPFQSGSFRFVANGFGSISYYVEVVKVPALNSFEMALAYPAYLNKGNEIIKGSGNAVVPEGTEITWDLESINANEIQMVSGDDLESFVMEGNKFTLKRRLFESNEYEIRTSNKEVKDYERLGYRIQVVKDASPNVRVTQELDSLQPNLRYFEGLASDDIAVSEIRLCYFREDEPQTIYRTTLMRPGTNVEQFYYTYPSGLELEPGLGYTLFFEVVDNDGLRGGKVVRSQEFSTQLYDDKQQEERVIENQKSILKNFERTVDQMEEQQRSLKEINDTQKENQSLDFNQKGQIKEFVKKQEQQEALMQKFSKQLKENLDKSEQPSEMNELLKERLERQEREAEKNKKLLEELDKVADKIEKEDLKKRLEDLAKSQSSSKRNLEQLLELTKRYYVTEKAAQLSRKLQELAGRQELLSKLKLGEEFSNEEQQKLNESFEAIDKELDDLKKDNDALKRPLDFDFEKEVQESIKKDQSEALEEINKHQGSEQSSSQSVRQQSEDKIGQKQRSASKKMQELSQRLGQSSSAGGGSSIVEDAEMLRQILDNLIRFSFQQEGLFDRVSASDDGISEFSKTIRKQKQLRGLFEHVDDSLFALSLRRAELSELVNTQITEVYYNIDKSLESIANNQLYQGASYQQYVLTASNTLADFLADLLDNMQQSMMSGQGKGQGEGFQLPDIIKGQSDLQDRMQQGGSSGKGKQGNSEQGQQEGSEGKQGQEGSNGQKGSQGKQGNGEEGKGQNGEGNGAEEGSGNGGSGSGNELGLEEVYEIYKEQQNIRAALEKQLANMIRQEDLELSKRLLRQMEDFENDLLENGITERTLNKMNNIQHQLLKLENAALEQGKNSERKSETNTTQYSNPITSPPGVFKAKKPTVEILNRQALPLRRVHQEKVKVYFKDGN
ncbi:MAG: hypothetical protein HRT65_03050 [Flavobacteriaceae bacterium]|nr:hypothetical protein [Flavobacteriaceae bacterium]